MENVRKNLVLDQNVSRRSLFGIMGLVGLSLSGLAGAIINVLFLKPEVNYGPPTLFSAGRPEDYKDGVSQIFENERVIVMKGKKGFAAISLICTHLGCTVRLSPAGFECPCHGSQFDDFGAVTGGPAPENLCWFQLSVTPSGELEVNKSVKIAQGEYFVS